MVLDLELGAHDDPGAAWREDAARSAARVDRALFEAASDAVFVGLDDAGDGPVPPALAGALGLEPETDVPVTALLAARLHPAHRTWFHAGLDAHRRAPEGHPFDVEIALAHRSRGWRWFRFRAASRVGPDGAARRTVLAVWDVTELRALREQAEASKARAETLETELARLRDTVARRPVRAPRRSRAEGAEARRALEAAEARLARVEDAVARARAALEALPRPRPRPRSGGPALRAALETLRSGLDELRAPTEPLLSELQTSTEELGLVALNAQLEALHLGSEGSGLGAVAGSLKRLARSILRTTEDLGLRLAGQSEAGARIAEASELVTAASEALAAEDGSEPALDLGPLRAALDEARRLAQPAARSPASSPPTGSDPAHTP